MSGFLLFALGLLCGAGLVLALRRGSGARDLTGPPPRALSPPRPAPIDAIEIVTSVMEAVDGADHIVIAAPSTSETRHLVDEAVLAAVKPGVHIVNIARGTLIDQDALHVALDTPAGDTFRVGMASLDVTTPEPLPAGHWLYDHPRVRISPHISWSMPTSQDLLFDTFRQNLHRFRAGEPLEGVVDPALGY